MALMDADAISHDDSFMLATTINALRAMLATTQWAMPIAITEVL